VLCMAACASPPNAKDTSTQESTERLFIIGQDLGAIRGYMDSACCVAPDGMTAYVDFYEVLSEPDQYGGLGFDDHGQPYLDEATWGAGPVNAYLTATEYPVRYLAIGLSITENEHPGGLARIANGEHDAEIAHLANFIAALDTIVLLRIGYEFDGYWNAGYGNAPQYVAAFRRIVDGLRAAGTSNVQTVWQGAASTTDMVLDNGRHDQIGDWYPGDDYVDWFGFSWFMEPDEQPGIDLPFAVLTPRELADEIVDMARERKKPVLIAEAAPQGYDLRDRTTAHHVPIWDGEPGSDVRLLDNKTIWRNWFQPMFDYMAANDDVILGFAYINARWDDQPMWGPPYASGYWGDTRVEVNRDIGRWFNQAVRGWKEQRD
ncbi:MAG: hypothetical protein AAFZ58_13805, partial [Pseudomonadota bacterium]